MKRPNYIVRIVLRKDLTLKEKNMVQNEITALKEKLGIKVLDDGITYYKEVDGNSYEDIPIGVVFYIKLQKYKKYFSIYEYCSYLEGVEKGGVE